MSEIEDNVISFEEYRRRKAGRAYVPDLFSAEFDRALSEQSELLDWYIYNRHFNKYRLFLHSLLRDNEISKENPNAGFVLAYEQSQYDELVKSLGSASRLAGREFLPILFSDNSFMSACAECSYGKARTQVEAFKALEHQLLATEKVIIISGLSRCRTRMGTAGVARSLIKVIDDMWVTHKTYPESCLLFVDSPIFLQKAWPEIGSYLNVLG